MALKAKCEVCETEQTVVIDGDFCFIKAHNDEAGIPCAGTGTRLSKKNATEASENAHQDA